MRIDFIPWPCPVCGGADNQPVLTDINRRQGLPIFATLVECQNSGMRYLNPAPDAASLAQLYSDGSVDPVTLDPVTVQPVPRTLAPVGRPRLCFNAHRIHAVETICEMLPELELVEFSGVTDEGEYMEEADLAAFRDSTYACGLFWFRRS